MLPYYAERFSTTESNYTFRQMPKVTTLERWAERTPEQFSFSLKAPQRITHFAKLRDCGETLQHFCGVARALGPKLGAILFQLPPSLTKDVPVLAAFLEELPAGTRAAFEFRHESWFADDVYEVLRASNVALCIAHSDELLTPVISTADYGYLRLREVQYASADFAKWAAVLRQRTEWKEAFVYFKHEESGTGPQFAQKLAEALEKHR
jgi:uncharacterized protein YecE (DUF72 family)